MGVCYDSEKDPNEFKTVEDDSLLVLEFGDSSLGWNVGYPQGSDLIQVKGDSSVRLTGIDSKHKKGYTPLGAIRLAFSNGQDTDWFSTSKCKKDSGEDMEEISTDVDSEREIREIAVRVSIGNQICAMQLLDKDGEVIADIEWENFDLGREWKI